jgi:hypothetical protein
MKTDVATGKLTAEALAGMKEEAMAARYEVSREPARKARANVLSELDLRQTPTSDK